MERSVFTRAFGVQLLRSTVIIGVLLITAGFVAYYPGSIPTGWRQTDGTISSVVGKSSGKQRLYYPLIQYLALGYSYEMTDTHSFTTPPDVGTTERIAFNPEQPGEAKVLATAPPNYYRVGLPVLGVLVIAGGAYAYTASRRPARASVAAKAIASETQAKLAPKPLAATQPAPEQAATAAPEAQAQTAPVEEAAAVTVPPEPAAAIVETKAPQPAVEPAEATVPAVNPPATTPAAAQIAKPAKRQTKPSRKLFTKLTAKHKSADKPKKPAKARKAAANRYANPQKEAIMLSRLKFDQ